MRISRVCGGESLYLSGGGRWREEQRASRPASSAPRSLRSNLNGGAIFHQVRDLSSPPSHPALGGGGSCATSALRRLLTEHQSWPTSGMPYSVRHPSATSPSLIHTHSVNFMAPLLQLLVSIAPPIHPWKGSLIPFQHPLHPPILTICPQQPTFDNWWPQSRKKIRSLRWGS